MLGLLPCEEISSHVLIQKYTPLFCLHLCINSPQACPQGSVFQTPERRTQGPSTVAQSGLYAVMLPILAAGWICWPSGTNTLQGARSCALSPLAVRKCCTTWAWCAHCLFSAMSSYTLSLPWVTLIHLLTLAAQPCHHVNSETRFPLQMGVATGKYWCRYRRAYLFVFLEK